MTEYLKYIPIAIPLITGYASSAICRMEDSGKSGENVLFRPPAAAFGIVWPILYILMGVAWYVSREKFTENDRLTVDIFFF